MLTMSAEGSSVLEPFIADWEIPYPVASDADYTSWGLTGWPTAYLLDHNGDVLWAGNTGFGWVDMLPAALKTAEELADRWDPGERAPALEKAVEMVREAEMGKAWRETGLLLNRFAEDEDLREQVEAFRSDLLARAERKDREVARLAGMGRYFEAQQYLDRQMDLFKGTPPADGWKETLKAWKKDRAIKDLTALDKKRMEALAKARTGEAEKAAEALADLLEDAEGTPLAESVRVAHAFAVTAQGQQP